MNDLLFLADLQSGAHIDAQPYHLSLREPAVAFPLGERGQEFHADVNIPADLPDPVHDLVILHADDVLDALQALHQLDLIYKVIHDAL